MTTNNHTAISTGAPANAAIFNSPLAELDAAIGTKDQKLIGWVEGECYEMTTITWDADGVIVYAGVKWPDGAVGTFTTVTKNTTWLAIDAYTITHATLGKTVTQSLVTRDGDGNITVKPILTVT